MTIEAGVQVLDISLISQYAKESEVLFSEITVLFQTINEVQCM